MGVKGRVLSEKIVIRAQERPLRPHIPEIVSSSFEELSSSSSSSLSSRVEPLDEVTVFRTPSENHLTCCKSISCHFEEGTPRPSKLLPTFNPLWCAVLIGGRVSALIFFFFNLDSKSIYFACIVRLGKLVVRFLLSLMIHRLP